MGPKLQVWEKFINMNNLDFQVSLFIGRFQKQNNVNNGELVESQKIDFWEKDIKIWGK